MKPHFSLLHNWGFLILVYDSSVLCTVFFLSSSMKPHLPLHLLLSATQASVVAAVDLTAWMELKPRTSWVPVDQCWGLTFLSSKAQDCARQRSLVPALHLRLLHRKQQPHLFLLS